MQAPVPSQASHDKFTNQNVSTCEFLSMKPVQIYNYAIKNKSNQDHIFSLFTLDNSTFEPFLSLCIEKRNIQFLTLLFEIYPGYITTPRLLYTLCSCGHVDVLKVFLRLDLNRVNLAYRDNVCLLTAIEKINVEFTRTLLGLKNRGIDPTVYHGVAMTIASKMGNADMIQLLLQLEYYRGVDMNDAFLLACVNGNVKVATLLVDRVDPADQDNAAFIFVSANGYIDLVNFLLELPSERGIDPSAQNNRAIIEASANNHIHVVALLIHGGSKRGVDISARDNIAFIHAAANGQYAILSYMLELAPEYKVNPASKNNEAIIVASSSGHLNIIKLLLSYIDRGVRANARNNSVFIVAVSEGHVKIVQYLLDLGKNHNIDPSDRDNEAIIEASNKGYVQIFNILLTLKNRGIECTAQNNLAFILASKGGYLLIVERLFAIPNVNPADQGNAAFIMATENGHFDVVCFLASSGIQRGVDPAANENKALTLAAQNGHLRVVRFLLGLSGKLGVNQSNGDFKALILASKNGHFKIVQLLLAQSPVIPTRLFNSAIEQAVLNHHKEVVLTLQIFVQGYTSFGQRFKKCQDSRCDVKDYILKKKVAEMRGLQKSRFEPKL